MQSCIFENDECWYRHEVVYDSGSAPGANIASTAGYDCRKCEYKAKEQSNLMKHMKEVHPKDVSKCWKFTMGNCKLSEEACWFKHKDGKNLEKESSQDDVKLGKNSEIVEENDVIMDEEYKTNDSDFQEAQEKTPPDQMSHLIEIVMNLALQMKNMEMKMPKNC